MSDQQERHSHLVLDAGVREAALREGTAVTSVCGKEWVPSRDPDKFQLCEHCVDAVRRGWMA